MPSSEVARVLAQQARCRAAGQPAPAVLVGAAVVDAWTVAAKGTPIVRLAATDPESAAVAYLEDSHVRARLRELVEARVGAVRGRAGPRTEAIETSFERGIAVEVCEDALLDAGDVDGHLVCGYVFGARPVSSPLRSFAAALRVLGGDAPPIVLDLEPARLDVALRVAIGLVEAAPAASIGVPTTAEAWRDWQAAPGRDHAKAMVRPYAIELSSKEAPSSLERARRLVETARRSAAAEDDELARSAAERALFDALEADERSRGLFALNASLAVFFGTRPLEIDLSCRELRLAVEVDGFFHFRDSDAYRRDRRKDLVLQREGYLVVRVLAEDVASRIDEVLSTIHDAIAWLSLRAKETSR